MCNVDKIMHGSLAVFSFFLFLLVYSSHTSSFFTLPLFSVPSSSLRTPPQPFSLKSIPCTDRISPCSKIPSRQTWSGPRPSTSTMCPVTRARPPSSAPSVMYQDTSSAPQLRVFLSLRRLMISALLSTGPKTNNVEMLSKLRDAGMNIVRMVSVLTGVLYRKTALRGRGKRMIPSQPNF